MVITYSIIIPTLNEERLLPKLLSDLNDGELRKRYDYEIIVSDGGSLDSTLEIANKYADKVVLYEPGEIKTISSGRSKGARFAKGDYLLFINADVTIDFDKFFQITEQNFIKSDFAALTCAIKVDSESETPKDRAFSCMLNYYFHFINLIGIGMARGECQLIRKEIYEKAGGYKDEIVAGEDFELFTRIRKLGRVLFVKDFYVYESPRRYQKWGYTKILALWFVNSISSWIFNKSFVSSWEEIR